MRPSCQTPVSAVRTCARGSESRLGKHALKAIPVCTRRRRGPARRPAQRGAPGLHRRGARGDRGRDPVRPPPPLPHGRLLCKGGPLSGCVDSNGCGRRRAGMAGGTSRQTWRSTGGAAACRSMGPPCRCLALPAPASRAAGRRPTGASCTSCTGSARTRSGARSGSACVACGPPRRSSAARAAFRFPPTLRASLAVLQGSLQPRAIGEGTRLLRGCTQTGHRSSALVQRRQHHQRAQPRLVALGVPGGAPASGGRVKGS